MQHEPCKLRGSPAADSSLIVPVFGREVHLYRAREGVRAAADVRLHFGGPPQSKDDKFTCPRHVARCDSATAEENNGPASTGSELLFDSRLVAGDAHFYIEGEHP